MRSTILLTFGSNDDGQLGHGERRKTATSIDEDGSERNNVLVVSSLAGNDVIAVSCGSRHTMALLSDGTIYSWGWGAMGQLGHGHAKNVPRPQPIDFFVEKMLKITYISAGGCHSGAITDQGVVYMWGETHWGQLGLAPETSQKRRHRLLPSKCPVIREHTSEKVVKLSCGGVHTAALTSEGVVYSWGRCDSGQLGIGNSWLYMSKNEDTLFVHTPNRLGLEAFQGEKVYQVACGAFHTAAITDSGRVYAWGKEDYGMLGMGLTSDIQIPQEIELFRTDPATRISCGGWHTVVVTKSGACYTFGRGEYGRLGHGDIRSRNKPERVNALSQEVISNAASGGTHTIFLTNTGEIYSAGRQDHGRLGHNEESLIPVKITNFNNIQVSQISAGGAHSAALVYIDEKE